MLDVAALAALLKRKRGEARLTQETLAQDVFGDSARKADISRLENGKVANPQEATLQKLCKALNISAAEMEPIRQSRITAAQLDNIPTLSREELQNIAARFQIEGAFERPDEDLRKLLTLKAEEYRALKSEVDAISEDMKRLANLKAAAQDAIARVDLEEVENLLSNVQEAELEEAAKTAELRANNALLRGDVDKAFLLLSTAADSFAAVDALEPARRRILRYNQILKNHGRRYGGNGLIRSAEMISVKMTENLKNADSGLWAAGQNTLAIALGDQGKRTAGSKGADLLAQAVNAYRAALEIYTRADHPLQWAMAQNNLGADLMHQGNRTKGAKGADLLAKAVTAFRAALEVYTRADHALQWAMAQNNLANALSDQGARTEGTKGADLLAQAVAAYRAALEVRTRADHPMDWATTQNNLAAALSDQGTRTKGAKGADLLAQAVDACRAALEVRTRNAHPVQWATTHVNIAISELARANHGSCTAPEAALQRGLEAVDASLTILNLAHLSAYHATATDLRNHILARLNP